MVVSTVAAGAVEVVEVVTVVDVVVFVVRFAVEVEEDVVAEEAADVDVSAVVTSEFSPGVSVPQAAVMTKAVSKRKTKMSDFFIRPQPFRNVISGALHHVYLHILYRSAVFLSRGILCRDIN